MSDVIATNFIEEIINYELDNNIKDHVVTRFPPEPNGYLHIGHAKSLCINFNIKDKYQGQCNLRYDDTNPAKEDVEYVESIKEDIKWLGFSWDRELYASDYFDQLFEYAVGLIKEGKAYVCDMSADEIKNSRGTLTEPGKESPYKNRSIEENLQLFYNMKDGKYPDGSKVLRAKIDMASPNMNMRDPVVYRILRCKHHRTGDKWCIYPMYDFAHPISDAIEGITHSICTLEFEDHRPLYDWFKINCGFANGPRQIEFARLNLTRTIMSKRYLKMLVDKGIVDGWSDPRMPTLSGIRERGYPAEAVKDFCERIGVSKANSEVDFSLLEHCVREYLNENALRAMVVEKPLKLIIDNRDDNYSEQLTLNDKLMNDENGTHIMTLSNTIYIEQDDFMVTPPPKYHRLTVGGIVRLKGAYILSYKSHEIDANGNVVAVHCDIIEDSKSGGANAGIKCKGVIHWVDAKNCIDCKLYKYDNLLIEGNTDLDFSERMNPNSLQIVEGAKGEMSLKSIKPYERFQFLRQGYFMSRKEYGDNKYVFTEIVGLKDSYKG